jgi:hypothetical protein
MHRWPMARIWSLDQRSTPFTLSALAVRGTETEAHACAERVGREVECAADVLREKHLKCFRQDHMLVLRHAAREGGGAGASVCGGHSAGMQARQAVRQLRSHHARSGSKVPTRARRIAG